MTVTWYHDQILAVDKFANQTSHLTFEITIRCWKLGCPVPFSMITSKRVCSQRRIIKHYFVAGQRWTFCRRPLVDIGLLLVRLLFATSLLLDAKKAESHLPSSVSLVLNFTSLSLAHSIFLSMSCRSNFPLWRHGDKDSLDKIDFLIIWIWRSSN